MKVGVMYIISIVEVLKRRAGLGYRQTFWVVSW